MLTQHPLQSPERVNSIIINKQLVSIKLMLIIRANVSLG